MTIRAAASLVFALMLPGQVAQDTNSNSQDLVVVPDANGRLGFIDQSGAIVIQPKFLWAKRFYHGYGEVFVCGRHAFIDRSGNLFPYHPETKERLYPRQVGKKWGFADWSGKMVIPSLFEEKPMEFSEGLAAVEQDDAWGFIDVTGRFVIPPQFKEASYFSEGIAIVEIEDFQELLIDRAGKILPRNYDQLKGGINEGRIPAERDGKLGYLNEKGEMIIPPRYQSGALFHEGLAAVEDNDQWGYIDREGKLVIPFQFAGANGFSLGLAEVFLKDGRKGFINRSGEIAFYLDFESATEFSSPGLSMFWAADQKIGYMNRSGKVVWGPVKHSPSRMHWSKQDIADSCRGIPEKMKKRALTFPRNLQRMVRPPT
jgi:hypothetical protein